MKREHVPRQVPEQHAGDALHPLDSPEVDRLVTNLCTMLLAALDGPWYRRRYGIDAEDDFATLVNYLEVGADMGRDPCTEFRTDQYRARAMSAREFGVDPLVHYLFHRHHLARTEGIPSPVEPLAQLDQTIARHLSGTVDADYYLEANPDVRAEGADPVVHFALHGWAEGRMPRAPRRPIHQRDAYRSSNPAARAHAILRRSLDQLMKHRADDTWRHEPQSHTPDDRRSATEAAERQARSAERTVTVLQARVEAAHTAYALARDQVSHLEARQRDLGVLLDLLRGELRNVRRGRPPHPPRDGRGSGITVVHSVARKPGDQSRRRREAGVTVAVRFHDYSRLAYLRRALYSIMAQRGVTVQVVVVMQGPGRDDERRVRRLVDSVWLTPRRPVVISVPNPDHADLRSVLLNRALEYHYASSGNAFFYVLDSDDVTFSHCLDVLANPIAGTEIGLSYGRVDVARDFTYAGFDVTYQITDEYRASGRDPVELLADNFLPIHSYVYHTAAMPRGALSFNEEMTRLEDYECLLRVLARYPVFAGAADRLVGLYHWHVGSESVLATRDPAQSAAVEAEWARNRVLLESTRRGLLDPGASRAEDHRR